MRMTGVEISNGEYRLVLSPDGRGAYRVTFDGEVIVRSSHSPEAAAARILVARGLAGLACTYHAGSATPCLRFDLEQMARAAERQRADIERRLRGQRLPRPHRAHAGKHSQGAP